MSSADAPPTEEDAAPEPDELREALLADYVDELGDAVVGSHIDPGRHLWVRVTRDAWVPAHRFTRSIQFGFFEFLAGIDWSESPFGKSEDARVDVGLPSTNAGDIETGVAGGDTRFQVMSRLFDVRERHTGVFLTCDIPDDDLSIDTVIGVYAGANWHERELSEMFGITVTGHPYLEHLYLPTDFEGHPMRKDFPLVARMVKPWPGIVDVEPMPGDDDEEDPDADGAEGDD